MSWLKEKICPVCKAGGFDPDCDKVDTGIRFLDGTSIGIQEFNFRGICPSCGDIAQCGDCGTWVNREKNVCVCGISEGDDKKSKQDLSEIVRKAEIALAYIESGGLLSDRQCNASLQAAKAIRALYRLSEAKYFTFLDNAKSRFKDLKRQEDPEFLMGPEERRAVCEVRSLTYRHVIFLGETLSVDQGKEQ